MRAKRVESAEAQKVKKGKDLEFSDRSRLAQASHAETVSSQKLDAFASRTGG